MNRLALLLLIPLALGLAACGAKSENIAAKPEQLTLVLDFTPNADHAGIYAAQASGAFKRAGLDVKIITPSDPSIPLKLVQAGKADLAISYEPELLLARDKGPRLVSIAALVQEPLTTLMSLDRDIHTPADLKGKTVGTAGIPYQTAYLQTILKKAGVDPGAVKEVNVGFDLIPAMVSKRVNATLGAFWNYEGVKLQQRGKRPTILRMETLGVPTYNELILVAAKKTLNTDEGAKLRRFIQALAHGYTIARDDPEQAVDALATANPALDRNVELASIRATSGAFFPSSGHPYGYQDPAQWKAYGDWMKQNGLLKHDPLADNAITNEFLPGQGLEP